MSRFVFKVSLAVASICAALIGLALAVGSATSSGEVLFDSFRGGNRDLYILDINRAITQRLTRTKEEDWSPAWSPDGRQIVYSTRNGDTSGIYLMDASGSGPHFLVPNHAVVNKPVTWSSDGRWLVVTTSIDRKMAIYLVSLADPSLQQPLIEPGVNALAPAWSPDNHQIVFSRALGDNQEIYTMDFDLEVAPMISNRSQLRRLTDHPYMDTDPAWSPDGRWIVFSSFRDNNHEIYRIAPDGSGLRRLTDSPASDVDPAWSPDGQHIVFVSNRSGAYALYMMDIDGGSLRRLTNSPGDDRHPSWRP